MALSEQEERLIEVEVRRILQQQGFNQDPVVIGLILQILDSVTRRLDRIEQRLFRDQG